MTTSMNRRYIVDIENGSGSEKVGSFQRRLLTRMAFNEGQWNPEWWLDRNGRRAMNAMDRRGFVEQVTVKGKLTWQITNSFWDRIVIREPL